MRGPKTYTPEGGWLLAEPRDVGASCVWSAVWRAHCACDARAKQLHSKTLTANDLPLGGKRARTTVHVLHAQVVVVASQAVTRVFKRLAVLLLPSQFNA